MQVSDWLQALPSSHGLPSGLAGLEQAPLAVLQTPASWHWSAAVHATGLLPVHVPSLHASVRVQAFPSSQVVPSALSGLEQRPIAGSQTPASWHWSLGGHSTGLVPVHTPARQASASVQALPSSHAVPSGFAGFERLEQRPVSGSHTPAS